MKIWKLCARLLLAALALTTAVTVCYGQTQAGTRVYVANYGSFSSTNPSTVSVIDATIDPTTAPPTVPTVIATVPVGVNPFGVAAKPDGTRVYVTNSAADSLGASQIPTIDGTVSVINTATNMVEATVTVGKRPLDLAFNPAGTRLYVPNFNTDNVSVIDTDTTSMTFNIVVATVALPSGSGPFGVAFTPDGQRAYVTARQLNEVFVIDATANPPTLVMNTATPPAPLSVAVGVAPLAVAINPAGTRLFVANEFDGPGTISVIDITATPPTVVATVELPTNSFPQGQMVVNPAGTRLYVADEDNGNISVIDITATPPMVVANVFTGSGPIGVGLSPDGSRAYSTAFNTSTTYVINTATNTVVATVPVGLVPNGLAVVNVAPKVGPITVQPALTQVNTTINTSANFTDPLPGAHTAVWDWGDGTTSTGIVTEANGSVSGSHTYTAAGVYTVTLTVTNNTSNLSGQSVFQFVVVFDPSAGFVTGGGFIISPAGAYAADPTLTGKANFGFVSKYQKGATVPTGNTEFQFHAANFNFHSTSYDWLVISGAKAQYKGSGTINGAGDYGFLLTAIDGELPGGGGVDKFRIKIVDKTTGSVIYDNQVGATDTANPTTAIAGGDIVIHQ